MDKDFPEHLMCKNRLQEYTQKFNLPLPSYHTLNEGFQHAPMFKATVLVDGSTYESRLAFPHRKEAEQDAAKCALECIRVKMKHELHFDINKNLKSCKSILNEYAVRMNLIAPKYTTIQKEKLRPVFFSSLFFDGKTYTGEVCASKKEAEQLAARVVIQTLLGSDSGVLRQIINSKGKVASALHKVRTSSFKQNSLSTVKKSVESSQQLIVVEPSTAQENNRKLEKAKVGGKNMPRGQ